MLSGNHLWGAKRTVSPYGEEEIYLFAIQAQVFEYVTTALHLFRGH
jgi:hypothetical protein